MNQVSVVPPPDPDEHAAKPGAIRAAVARKATALVLNLIVLLTNCKVLSALKLRVLATLEEIQVMWGENPNFGTSARARLLDHTRHSKRRTPRLVISHPNEAQKKLPGLDSNQ